MSSLQIDLSFPIAVLSVAALCIVALRSVETWAERRTRERTQRVIAEATRVAEAARRAGMTTPATSKASPDSLPVEPGA